MISKDIRKKFSFYWLFLVFFVFNGRLIYWQKVRKSDAFLCRCILGTKRSLYPSDFIVFQIVNFSYY